MGLLKETLSTFLDNHVASFKLEKFIKPKLKKGEIFHLSPKIFLGTEYYRVARLGYSKISFKTKEIIDFQGYLILDKIGNIVQNSQLIKEVLPVYELWYYNYTHSTFSTLAYNFPSVIDFQVKNIKELEVSIKLRTEKGYQREKMEFGEKYADILEQLDKQVLKHNHHQINELDLIKKFLETEKRYFDRLSIEEHRLLFHLSSAIRTELLNQNIVWNRRCEIWGEFVELIKDLNKKGKSKVDVELIESLTIDAITIPFPLPLAGTAYLLLKRQYIEKAKKVKEWYYEDILKQKLGLEMINQHIKDNLKLMEKLNTLTKIIQEIDYSKVRT